MMIYAVIVVYFDKKMQIIKKINKNGIYKHILTTFQNFNKYEIF